MARITFPDGRWVQLRPMYVADELAFHEMAEAGTEVEKVRERVAEVIAALGPEPTEEQQAAALEALSDEAVQLEDMYFKRMQVTLERMQEACSETSWGGPLADRLTRSELYGLVRRWRTATEDDALPPDNGPSSETP